MRNLEKIISAVQFIEEELVDKFKYSFYSECEEEVIKFEAQAENRHLLILLCREEKKVTIECISTYETETKRFRRSENFLPEDFIEVPSWFIEEMYHLLPEKE